MSATEYRYALLLSREDGSSLGQVAINVNWAPALAWCHLAGVHRGALSPEGVPTSTSLKPRWHETSGAPRVQSVCATVCDSTGSRFETELPVSYFAGAADRASALLVERKMLEVGDYFRYTVVAYPCERREPETVGAGVMTVEEIAAPLPLGEACFDRFVREAVAFGPTDDLDLPLFIPREVLDQAAELSRQAGSLETGGVLVGYLHVDPSRDRSRLFVEVTAQIPVDAHAKSELTKLTFTPETWTAVRGALALRRRGELMVGWWHSHSYMKETCAACEKAETCTVGACFMSSEDRRLHRTCFPGAFSVALVVGDEPRRGLSYAMFGYRHGLISEVGFHVLQTDAAAGDRRGPDSIEMVKGGQHVGS